MSQSEWIGAILIAGFILWLAITQRLSAYWSILLGGGAAPPPPQASGGTSTAPQIGTATGDVLTGPGLTGNSTSTGQNTTSTPTINNLLQWLQKNYPDFSQPAPVPNMITPAQ
jgi:hypothetical protein